jgi:hypothetical protein
VLNEILGRSRLYSAYLGEEFPMKLLLLCAAALSLTGCAVYPAGTYGGYGYESAPVVVNPPPVYLYGSGVYRSGSHAPGGHRQHRGWRDSDRDGVPNRADRDRDGDGVPNRRDSRPGNPYYR